MHTQALCSQNQKEAYKAWVEWLKDDSISSADKCEVLHKVDDQGWCALHYAVRYYCTDVLNAALQVEGGM